MQRAALKLHMQRAGVPMSTPKGCSTYDPIRSRGALRPSRCKCHKSTKNNRTIQQQCEAPFSHGQPLCLTQV